MGGGVGGLVVLLALGQLILQLLDSLLQAAVLDHRSLNSLLHRESKVVLDVLLGNLQAPLKGGPHIAVQAQGIQDGLDFLQGLTLLVLGGRGVLSHQLHIEDVGGLQACALERGLESLLRRPLVRGSYHGVLIGAAGELVRDFVGVHGYFSFFSYYLKTVYKFWYGLTIYQNRDTVKR